MWSRSTVVAILLTSDALCSRSADSCHSDLSALPCTRTGVRPRCALHPDSEVTAGVNSVDAEVTNIEVSCTESAGCTTRMLRALC